MQRWLHGISHYRWRVGLVSIASEIVVQPLTWQRLTTNLVEMDQENETCKREEIPCLFSLTNKVGRCPKNDFFIAGLPVSDQVDA